MTEPQYRGVPLSQLRIDSIEWLEPQATHIKTRKERYPDREEFDVEPEWATEAALDPKRLIASAGNSIEAIGWSNSAPSRLRPDREGRVLKVWIYPKDMDAGEWCGASACDGNRKNRKEYEDQFSD